MKSILQYEQIKLKIAYYESDNRLIKKILSENENLDNYKTAQQYFEILKKEYDSNRENLIILSSYITNTQIDKTISDEMINNILFKSMNDLEERIPRELKYQSKLTRTKYIKSNFTIGTLEIVHNCLFKFYELGYSEIDINMIKNCAQQLRNLVIPIRCNISFDENELNIILLNLHQRGIIKFDNQTIKIVNLETIKNNRIRAFEIKNKNNNTIKVPLLYADVRAMAFNIACNTVISLEKGEKTKH